MGDEFRQKNFETSEDLLRHLQERSDDFESATIVVANSTPMMGPQGQKQLAVGCCGVITTCSGESIMIHRKDFEVLLNEGILHRLKIPILLMPLVAE